MTCSTWSIASRDFLRRWTFDYETDGYWNYGRVVVLADDYHEAFHLAFRMIAEVDYDQDHRPKKEKPKKRPHRKGLTNTTRSVHVTRLELVL